MKKRILLFYLFSMTYTLVISQNIVYIYRDSIYRSIPGFIATIQRVDSLKKAYSTEINQKQSDLQTQWHKLLSSYMPQQNESVESIKQRMSVPDTTRLGILIQENKTLQERSKSYVNIVSFITHKEIDPVIMQVNNAISVYAQKNKTDLVLEMDQIHQSVAYMNRRINITSQIIKIVTK